MQAVLSGRACVALLQDGDVWSSLHYDDPERLIPCEPPESSYLLRGVRDLVWLEDMSVDQVRDRLADEVDSSEALDCVLLLLDETLSADTRDIVAQEFEELAVDPEIIERIENVLLSMPFPKSADIAGAIAACERTKSANSKTHFERWLSLQEVVRQCRDAWESFASDCLDSDEEFGDCTDESDSTPKKFRRRRRERLNALREKREKRRQARLKHFGAIKKNRAGSKLR